MEDITTDIHQDNQKLQRPNLFRRKLKNEDRLTCYRI